MPFLDLARESRALRSELLEAVAGVIDSGIALNGPEIEALESELAAFLGVPDVVAVSSGTVALQVALLTHGIGPGDEVIVPAASFYATAMAVHGIGATPVFVDVDPLQWNIDPEHVLRALTRHTRAVIVVHLYGCPGPLDLLRRIADEHGIALVEDMAQAIGASIGARAVGSWGDAAALSFYPTKNAGAFGDAGAVALRDPAMAHRARAVRFLGFTGRRDYFDGPGLSGRMDELQATIIRVKMRHLADHTQARARLARRYDDALPRELRRPSQPDGKVVVNHLYVIHDERRDALAQHLAGIGVDTAIHYRLPLHRQPVFRAAQSSLPVAERWAASVLSLPLYPYLTDTEQDRVIDGVRSFAFEHANRN